MELRRRFESSNNKALVPRKDGAPGHPAFYSPLWRERFLSSDDSCRAALFRHEADVEWAEFDNNYVNENFFLDVDTPEDYRRLSDPQTPNRRN
jgi:CTP:molybdopterin cytidylyltransferase MocA